MSMRGGVVRGPRVDAADGERPAPAGFPPGWPQRHLSRFVDAAGLRWHVQCTNDDAGPVLLLLHGTGAACSSWRGLLPLLAPHFTVVAPDLPGHGFTSAMPAGVARLPEVAHAIARLMQALGRAPDFIVGHSAGAAIAAQMALAETPGVRRMVWLGGALRPLQGVAGRVGSPLARAMSRSALVTRLAAWRADDDAAVRRFLAATGSTLDAQGVAVYRDLLRRPEHIAGALALMGGWDLAPLQRALPLLKQAVLVVHGERDRTVAPAQSHALAQQLTHARLALLPGLGHLAHEEKPADVAELLKQWCGASG
jgi:magnesium chelatase accessory protein